MPAWLEILLLVVVALVALLALGGVVANARRRREVERDFPQVVEAANVRLAAAAAEDRGWDRGVLEEAARRAWRERHGDEEVLELALVEVVDRPGTDEDTAVFRVTSPHRVERVTLARRANEWTRAG